MGSVNSEFSPQGKCLEVTHSAVLEINVRATVHLSHIDRYKLPGTSL